MNRMMVGLACLALMGGLGCGDDEDDTASGAGGSASTSTTSGGGGSTGSRVDTILALTPDAAAGQMAFPTSCGSSSCHGPDGSGSTSNASDLSVRVPALSDAELVGVVLDGFSGDDGIMPGLGGVLEDQEIADLVAHVRATFP